MFSLICAWINRWVNNREAGDLRRYRAHYGVIVMVLDCCLPPTRSSGNRSRVISTEMLKISIPMLCYSHISREQWVNSLAPGRFKWNFGWLIVKLTLVTDGWVISCGIPLSWMSINLTDDKSILVQLMVWCRQATSHYLNQCWPRSMSPYGVTRPQWVMYHNNRNAAYIKMFSFEKPISAWWKTYSWFFVMK